MIFVSNFNRVSSRPILFVIITREYKFDSHSMLIQLYLPLVMITDRIGLDPIAITNNSQSVPNVVAGRKRKAQEQS